MSDIYTPYTVEHSGFRCYHCGKETRVPRLTIETQEIKWWKERVRRLESSLDSVCAEHARLFEEVKMLRENRYAPPTKESPASGSGDTK